MSGIVRRAVGVVAIAGWSLVAAGWPGQPAGALTTDEKFVSIAYADFLLRYPEPIELTWWTTYLSGGGGRTAMVANLFDSNEFKGLWVAGASLYYVGAIDPQVGSITSTLTSNDDFVASEVALLAGSTYFANSGSTNTGFVQALYQHTLLRPVDSPALSYWVGRLNAGTATRASTATSVIRSSESATVRVGGRASSTACPTVRLDDASSLAAGSYCIVLDRMADASGLSCWAGQLGATDQLPSLWASLSGSAEYYNNAQTRL